MMSENSIDLIGRDGHRFQAFVARPSSPPLGGLVVVQEMYGVNEYLKDVCKFYASHGYVSVAPSLFDRHQSNLVFDYTESGHAHAQKLSKSWNLDLALDDIDCAKDAMGKLGKVGVVGFCWGGTLVWLAACRRTYACAVSFYGSLIPDFSSEIPTCPTICHVGDEDKTMPPERVNSFQEAQPSVPVYVYSGAQHGFDNENRSNRYNRDASENSRRRTLKLFSQFIG